MLRTRSRSVRTLHLSNGTFRIESPRQLVLDVQIFKMAQPRCFAAPLPELHPAGFGEAYHVEEILAAETRAILRR